LVPLVDLPRDIPVSLDARSDFAVLCANCHRMIHRSDAPKDLADFRKIIRTP
jgi:5-methylcytosine-specific restriction protein A